MTMNSQFQSNLAHYNICDFGAQGDGVSKNTAPIQAAIDTAAEAGGGTVFVPAGVYVTGTIFLKSNITLHLDAGATLLGSPDLADYNPDDVFPENNVFRQELATGGHLVIAYRCTNVAIEGHGCINGNSLAFYDTTGLDLTLGNMDCRRACQHFTIPDIRLGQMILFCLSDNIRVSGVQLRNPSYWTLFLHGCRNVFIDSLLIENPPQTPNGDGIDIDCCQRVSVSNCIIKSSDDCITLRANETPLGKAFPCRDITVTNCVLSSGCNAIRVGVGNGTISHCTLNNLVIRDTRTGISLTASIPSLGYNSDIRHLNFSNIMMDVRSPLYMTNSQGADPLRDGAGIQDIVFTGIQGTATGAFLGSGIPSDPLRNITFRDVNIEMMEGSDNRIFLENGVPYPVDPHWGAAGYETIPCAMFLRYAQNVEIDNCTFRWIRPGDGWEDALQCVHVDGLCVSGGAWATPHPNRGSVVRLDACKLVSITNARAVDQQQAFLSTENMNSEDLTLVGVPEIGAAYI